MERIESELPRRPVVARSRGTGPDQQPAARSEVLANPLLQLQRDAGNAAVAHLLAVQRHTLDPEEEAGT